MKQEDFLRSLKNKLASAGSAKSLANRLGVAESHISDVLNERRDPGPKLLTALGLERVVTYKAKVSA